MATQQPWGTVSWTEDEHTPEGTCERRFTRDFATEDGARGFADAIKACGVHRDVVIRELVAILKSPTKAPR